MLEAVDRDDEAVFEPNINTHRLFWCGLEADSFDAAPYP
jgi:hypothetical protein